MLGLPSRTQRRMDRSRRWVWVKPFCRVFCEWAISFLLLFRRPVFLSHWLERTWSQWHERVWNGVDMSSFCRQWKDCCFPHPHAGKAEGASFHRRCAWNRAFPHARVGLPVIPSVPQDFSLHKPSLVRNCRRWVDRAALRGHFQESGYHLRYAWTSDALADGSSWL